MIWHRIPDAGSYIANCNIAFLMPILATVHVYVHTYVLQYYSSNQDGTILTVVANWNCPASSGLSTNISIPTLYVVVAMVRFLPANG